MELVSGTLLIITDTLSTRPSLFLLVYQAVSPSLLNPLNAKRFTLLPLRSNKNKTTRLCSSVHFLKIWAIIFDANYAKRPVKDKSGFVADHYMGEFSTL